jgi:hypothetical protein
MTAHAIFKTEHETVKVFNHGSDWQFKSDIREQWFSTHADLDIEESLFIAVDKYVGGDVYWWIK